MEQSSQGQALERNALSTLDLLIAGMSYMAPGFSLFFTTAVIAGQVGVYIPLVYLLAGGGVLTTAIALAEFSRLAPSAGSLQTFIERGFGRISSVTGGLVLMTGYLCLQGGVAVLFGGWSSQLLSDIGISGVPWELLTVAGVLAVTYLMVRGVHVSIRATWALFLTEFVIVLAIGIAVMVSGGADGLSTKPIDFGFHGVSLEALALGMVFATFSFVGFEGSVSFAEETPEPRRALPIAVVGGVGVISLLYIFATYAAVIGIPNPAKLAADSEPIATLAKLYAGPLEPLLKIAVLTSIIANLMAAGNANARILFNMGRERLVWPGFGRIHPKHHTPYVAIVAFMVATLVPGLVASATSSWDYLVIFGNVAGLGSLLALLIYMTATLSLMSYVRKAGHQLKLVPHVLVPIIGAAIWLVPLWGSVKPGQAYPFNTYPWITIGLIVAFALYAVLRGDRNHGSPGHAPVGPPPVVEAAGSAVD
jgi:amino acid transporter